MKLIDKLLLALLVLLLPVGLLTAQFFLADEDLTGSQSAVQGAVVDTTKLEQVIKDTVQQNQPQVQAPKKFSITSVSYASESGVLQLLGKAPYPNASILIFPTYVPPTPEPTPSSSPDPDENTEETDEEETEPLKSGSAVELYSIIPDEKGSFVYEYEVEEAKGIIEFRLEQIESISTVKFDLEQRRQLL